MWAIYHAEGAMGRGWRGAGMAVHASETSICETRSGRRHPDRVTSSFVHIARASHLLGRSATDSPPYGRGVPRLCAELVLCSLDGFVAARRSG